MAKAADATVPTPAPGGADKKALVDAIWDTYSALRMLDVSTMTLPQKKQYVVQIEEVLNAHIALENANFATLVGDATKQMKSLKKQAADVQKSLQGFQTTAQVLQIVGDALGVFEKIVALVPK